MVQIETLPNGVRLVTEAMDTVRSAALGIWVGGGSREETPEESGVAHFIEHMLFKGTAHSTAAELAGEQPLLDDLLLQLVEDLVHVLHDLGMVGLILLLHGHRRQERPRSPRERVGHCDAGKV